MNDRGGMGGATDAGWLARRIGRGTAREIAAAIRGLVEAGQIAAGDKLPTVRDMAEAAGVSVGTIAAAWSILRGEGFVSTRRRGGSIIIGVQPPVPAATPVPTRADRLPLDLAQGQADPALQPRMEAAFVAGLNTPNLNSGFPEYITAALREAVRLDWPYAAEAWFTAGGGSEGIFLALAAGAEAGDTVAIEQPSSPRLLAIVDRLGLKPVAVACDGEGPLPEALADALRRHRPAVFLYQPRAQLPLGIRVDAARLAALGDVLAAADDPVTIVEDDNTGPIALAEPSSLGGRFPDRVLHVRTYCKTYGVDLRTSVISGSPSLMARMAEKRSKGLAMNSRILQDALAFLIRDPAAAAAVARARERYAWRRRTLAAALARASLTATNPDGLVLWLSVADEAAALAALATYGITAGAGSACFIDPPATGRIRIATSRLPDDEQAIGAIADLIAAALRGGARPEFD